MTWFLGLHLATTTETATAPTAAIDTATRATTTAV
jgi:hypothetical protein